MRYGRNLGGVLCLCVLSLVAGCHNASAPTAHQEAPALLYMFPGVSGGPWYLGGAVHGLRQAGVTHAIRFDRWETPIIDWFGHLTDIEANRDRAQRVAAQIAEYQRENANARIDLVGYSAGGGIVILVLESLPPDVHVHNAVLAQAAISREYNLTAALERVQGKLVNLYSSGDWFILGWGTETFGTVDRHYGVSAGKDGFIPERAVPDPELRSKLVQVPWTPDTFWETGHVGGHAGILGHAWNRERIGPWLVDEDAAAECE
jgi:hypothetical protein